MPYNKVILVGNMTRDVELRYLTSGKAVGEIGLAINRKWSTESGEKKEEVTFVDCKAFGKSAETISQYARKGHAILIEGRLSLNTWDDKKTGEKRSKLSVIVEQFQFLSNKAPLETSVQQAERPQAEKPQEDDQENIPF